MDLSGVSGELLDVIRIRRENYAVAVDRLAAGDALPDTGNNNQIGQVYFGKHSIPVLISALGDAAALYEEFGAGYQKITEKLAVLEEKHGTIFRQKMLDDLRQRIAVYDDIYDNFIEYDTVGRKGIEEGLVNREIIEYLLTELNGCVDLTDEMEELRACDEAFFFLLIFSLEEHYQLLPTFQDTCYPPDFWWYHPVFFYQGSKKQKAETRERERLKHIKSLLPMYEKAAEDMISAVEQPDFPRGRIPDRLYYYKYFLDLHISRQETGDLQDQGLRPEYLRITKKLEAYEQRRRSSMPLKTETGSPNPAEAAGSFNIGIDYIQQEGEEKPAAAYWLGGGLQFIVDGTKLSGNDENPETPETFGDLVFPVISDLIIMVPEIFREPFEYNIYFGGEGGRFEFSVYSRYTIFKIRGIGTPQRAVIPTDLLIREILRTGDEFVSLIRTKTLDEDEQVMEMQDALEGAKKAFREYDQAPHNTVPLG